MTSHVSVLWLALMVAAPVAAQTPPATPPVTPPVAADPAFTACMASLRGVAEKQGITTTTFDTHAQQLAADMSVLDLLDAQPEFTTPLWDYLAALVDEQRVADGTTMLATHRELLELSLIHI